MHALRSLSIKRRLWIPVFVQLLFLILIGTSYVRSSELSEKQQADSAATASLASAVRAVGSGVQNYLYGKAEYGAVQQRLREAEAAALARAQTDLTERLNEIGSLVEQIQDTFERSNAIRKTIFDLTEYSIKQSDAYIIQTSDRLNDPGEHTKVTQLERQVLKAALVNSTDNLRIQLLFSAIEDDLGRSSELVQFLERGIERTATAAQRLAGTPLQHMAIEGGKANQQIRDLVQRHIKNVERRTEASKHVFSITDSLLDSIRKLETNRQKMVFDAFTSFLSTLMLVMLIATVALILFLFALARSISNPLRNLTHTMEQLAQNGGNLTFRLPAERHDEIGIVSHSVNQFIGKLQDIFCEVSHIVAALDMAAASTSESNSAVSTNAAQQKQETTRVALAITDMERSIQEVAGRAADAAGNAGSADNNVRQALESLENNIRGIEDLAAQIADTRKQVVQLERDSKNIGGILDVIRGVAEQTNLLALNAAIEAARAGEQGRGFAVVADEVRELASRTQEATQRIREMIVNLQGATDKVASAMETGDDLTQKCVAVARHAGLQLNDSASAITEISDQTAQIARAVEDQSAVAKEIERNIFVIADAAHSTAGEAGNAAETAEQLAGQARRLAGLVHQFSV